MIDTEPRTTKGRLFVLTGSVRSGKTTFLERAVAGWKSAGLAVGGFLSVARLRTELDQGYDLVDLKNGKSLPYLAHKGDPGWPHVGTWYFFPDVLEKAKSILCRDCGADILIVDEIGPLELGGGGLWPAFVEALASGARCLCVVREGILDEFRARIGPKELRVFRHGAPGILESLTAALTSDRERRGSRGEGA